MRFEPGSSHTAVGHVNHSATAIRVSVTQILRSRVSNTFICYGLSRLYVSCDFIYLFIMQRFKRHVSVIRMTKRRRSRPIGVVIVVSMPLCLLCFSDCSHVTGVTSFSARSFSFAAHKIWNFLPPYLHQSWYLPSSPQDPLLPADLSVHLTDLFLRPRFGFCCPLCAFKNMFTHLLNLNSIVILFLISISWVWCTVTYVYSKPVCCIAFHCT